MIRVAEPLAWEVDVEPVFAGRQLRLVADEVAAPESPASTAGRPAPGPEAVGSLAAFVVELGPGSDCCWCGDTLVGESHTGFRLVCRSCGAEVERLESVHDGDVRL
jgi:hypothetical protein